MSNRKVDVLFLLYHIPALDYIHLDIHALNAKIYIPYIYTGEEL
jgi:hypothetical protein